METTITATELARSLSDVLDRVRERNERFIIQRNGETIATIAPPEPRRIVMLHEALEELARRGVTFPGDGFADDLEAAQANQSTSEFPEWPS
jgi:antitoxin (DNA-binding transcriptional repressor) of toxin-antitoxin stability system